MTPTQIASFILYRLPPPIWNPADCTASKFSFTQLGLLATSIVTTAGGARSTKSRNSGKYYFEIGSTYNTNTAWYGGLCYSGMPLTSGRPGFDFTGGYFAFKRGNGQITNNAGYVGSGTSIASGQTVGFAVDLGANTVTFYINGVADVFGPVLYAAGGASMFPALYSETDTVGDAWRLRTTIGDLVYSPPTGFSAWGP